jgi:23S rRNA pseudouridine2605 synthase
MRLNRFLASAGLGSRRGVETLITDGRVKVNGRVVTDLATQVTEQDVVKVGQRVVRQERSLHILLYKPRGYVSTASDEQGRKTVFDCLPPEWPRLFHVGRLDQESEGLLILTNDGDLSLALTHPRYKIDKEYEVHIDKAFDPSHREKLLRGFHIIGGRAKMEALQQTGERKLRVVLQQGIKRQIRLMLYEVGYEVTRLTRIRIGPVRIADMKPGDWRMLTKHELAALRAGTAGEKPVAARATVARRRDEEELG